MACPHRHCPAHSPMQAFPHRHQDQDLLNSLHMSERSPTEKQQDQEIAEEN